MFPASVPQMEWTISPRSVNVKRIELIKERQRMASRPEISAGESKSSAEV